jgi:protein-S-isoprenylcysteine O-methyltransferase Ste14
MFALLMVAYSPRPPDAGDAILTGMDNLTKRALVGALRFQLALAALIFVPAWSLTFWQGWLYWLVTLAGMLAITLYFVKHDPALIERRMKAGPRAERQPRQKLIQVLAALLACALIVVSALDHRFGWSSVPPSLVIGGDALVALGYAIVFLVFHENSFTSAVIEVGVGQQVVTTGPYALVRHPMYAGTFLAFLGTPIALGSWWGLVSAILLAGLTVWRLRDEEEYLDRNLAGYADYRRNVRWRLVPWLW